MAYFDHDYVAAYRIVAPQWASTAFSGEGAKKFGGRWNSPGNSVVYLGGSRALAALEMLVHLTTPDSRKIEFQIFEVFIPTSLIQGRIAIHSGHERAAGDAWLREGKFLSLQVPSILIPEEPNFLLNPSHPAFSKITIGPPKSFHFDQRL